MMRMAQLQNRYPSPWKKSLSHQFGSKFVSVLIYGNQEGNIEVAAFQVSNQCAGLVRDGVIKASKEPQFFRVKKSTKEILYPDLFYRAKNEYGYNVQNKADPTFPIDFCVISVSYFSTFLSLFIYFFFKIILLLKKKLIIIINNNRFVIVFLKILILNL